MPTKVAQKFSNALERVLNHEPPQYVMGVEWFHGHPFKVTPAVLIPRPETEELVAWITAESRHLPHPSILDVGTGSGCIAVSLSLYIRSAKVAAIDVSPDALMVARENNSVLQGSVEFSELDVLNAEKGAFLALDIIVSNPPYVPQREMDEMKVMVKGFEPQLALFVPDHEPLLFYRRILEAGRSWLKPGGKVYFEIHRDQGDAVLELGQSLGYQGGCLRKDLQGNDRMVRFDWLG